MQLSRATGGAEGLKGDSRDKANELDGFGSGGGIGRVCGTDEGHMGLDDEDDGAGLNLQRLG